MNLEKWLVERGVTEVECLVPDMSGVPRGKILPARKFLNGLKDNELRIPESVFVQTVTGQYPDEDVTDGTVRDMFMRPDPNSVRLVPWYNEPTAQVICDGYYLDGSEVDIAPRHVLKRVIDLYHQHGWTPIVAPELEFFLVKVNTDPDYPLVPPIGRSGRPETSRQAFSIDAVNEFDPLFEDVYDYCDIQDIDIDTLAHEAGAAQMEINFNHGDPLDLADQVFLFKRTVRQTALKHKIYATFMAKPMQDEPGSSMHLHQNVLDKKTGKNLFSNAKGEESDEFYHHIGGLQKYIPSATPFFAPNVNSYRRMTPNSDAPINVHWSRDNRTVGLRIPVSTPKARRVENRVPGADTNPYLTIAASLACGYLGMIEKLKPTDPVKGDGYSHEQTLPRHLPDALSKLMSCPELQEVLGHKFIKAVYYVKSAEWAAYQRVISSWERENLLLNV